MKKRMMKKLMRKKLMRTRPQPSTLLLDKLDAEMCNYFRSLAVVVRKRVRATGKNFNDFRIQNSDKNPECNNPVFISVCCAREGFWRKFDVKDIYDAGTCGLTPGQMAEKGGK